MTYTALVYDQDQQVWWRFTDPIEIFESYDPMQVAPVIGEAEAAAKTGHYVVGFVAYEAASSFDAALTHQPAGDMPLVSFASFAQRAPATLPAPAAAILLQPEIDQAQFERIINRIKSELLAGNSYQINFTHRFKGHLEVAAETVFAALVQRQPTAYSVFIETADFAICSVSPELFFNRSGVTLTCEPMKGTRPRGRTVDEDQRLLSDLCTSPKDRAENLMIVDMVRNDLGRIANAGSVRVDQLFSTRAYPTVWQQVSEVSADVDASLYEIFKALFPCASVTGAPKAKSMQLIAELEAEPRGVYTGALGMILPGGDATFSVAIRTLCIEKATGQSVYGVGGGIVWDSDPTEEWHESLTKASVLAGSTPPFELLETMRFEPGEGVHRLQYHLDRLAQSAHFFDYPLDSEMVTEKLLALRFQEPRRLRLLLARDGSFELETLTMPEPKTKMRLKLAASGIDSNDVFLFHKTTRREVYETAFLARGEADDVILYNQQGQLTETTIANLYLEIDGELLTPAIDAGVLAGTYRRQMLEQGRAREATLDVGMLQQAARLFVSNSLRGLLEAELIDGED